MRLLLPGWIPVTPALSPLTAYLLFPLLPPNGFSMTRTGISHSAQTRPQNIRILNKTKVFSEIGGSFFVRITKNCTFCRLPKIGNSLRSYGYSLAHLL